MNPSDQARQVGVVDSWLAQVRVSRYQANPGNGELLTDTGALAAGFYDVTFTLSTNCALGTDHLYAEWRDAANSENIMIMGLFCASQLFAAWSWKNCKVASNERFRIVIETGFTGLVSGAIFAMRRA